MSFEQHCLHPLRKIATIHQVITMLATFENVLFPGPNQHDNHLYWSPDT